MTLHQTIEHASLTEDFNIKALLESFSPFQTPEQRILNTHHWTQDNLPGQKLALTSSFGIQSLLLLHYVRETGLEIPVLAIDINDPKYDRQRAYRDFLHAELGFNLHIIPAASDSNKVAAMNKALKDLNIGATLAGIRMAQTKNRQNKDFAELNNRNGTVSVHPLLDWPDSKTEFYLDNLPEHLHHPDYAPGVQMQGGAIVDIKTECGLHV